MDYLKNFWLYVTSKGKSIMANFFVIRSYSKFTSTVYRTNPNMHSVLLAPIPYNKTVILSFGFQKILKERLNV